jgi:hypothetical protein
MRTAIVQGEDAVVVPDYQDRAALALGDDHPLLPQLVEAGDAHEAIVAADQRLHDVNSPCALVQTATAHRAAQVHTALRHGDASLPPLTHGSSRN